MLIRHSYIAPGTNGERQFDRDMDVIIGTTVSKSLPYYYDCVYNEALGYLIDYGCIVEGDNFQTAFYTRYFPNRETGILYSHHLVGFPDDIAMRIFDLIKNHVEIVYDENGNAEPRRIG